VLDQTAFPAEPLERSLERLSRSSLGLITAALHAPRAAAADAVPVRPACSVAVRLELEDLSLLHFDHLRVSTGNHGGL
jgi:hypothetical protein